MKFEQGKILTDVTIIFLNPLGDERGSFTRTYCEEEFEKAGLPTQWVQCNQTVTEKKGAIRGMHWQAEPQGEHKLIRCLRGRVYDVVVDIRPESETFGKWEAFELSEDQPTQLYIPKGFAHGFQCLSDNSHLFYQMSEFYNLDSARGFRWDDPSVGISWPMECACISKKDKSHPELLSDSEFI